MVFGLWNALTDPLIKARNDNARVWPLEPSVPTRLASLLPPWGSRSGCLRLGLAPLLAWVIFPLLTAAAGKGSFNQG